jgi:drug/metabolite transporter (DMT)-like permease
LFFGGGSYMLKDVAGTVLIKKFYGSLGSLFFSILILLAHMIFLVQSKKHSVNCAPDSIYHKKHGLTNGLFEGIMGGVYLFAGQLCLLYAWDLDPAGAGVIFMMLIGICPVTSILAYFIFKEKFTFMQILGMVIALSAITAISVTSISGTWKSYLLGFLTLVLYSARNLNGRLMQQKGLDVYTGGILNTFTEGILGIFLFLYLLIFDDSLQEITSSTFYFAITGATIVALGQYLINQAVITGQIGVVVTLVNMNGPLFITLDLIFHQIFPELKTFLFLLVVLFGVLIMLFGDQVISSFSSKTDKEN